MSTKDEKQNWFTIEEAAAYLRVTKATIYNYMKDGLLTYYQLKSGRGRRFRKEDLDALLDKHQAD